MTNSDPIKSVEIVNTDIEKEHIDDKFSRLDIKAKTNKGEVVNIEIQLKEELFRISSNEKERMLYEDRKASLLDKVSALENAELKISNFSQLGIEEDFNTMEE